MPLSLLHCNEPRGFLQTWKTTAFPCIQTSNPSPTFDSWISLFLCCMEGKNNSCTNIFLSYAHHDASKQTAEMLAVHALSNLISFSSLPVSSSPPPPPSFSTPASSLGQNCQLPVSLPIQPLLNVCEIWIKVLHSLQSLNYFCLYYYILNRCKFSIKAVQFWTLPDDLDI